MHPGDGPTARGGRSSPAASTGGTATTNDVGVLRVATGTPVINPGGSAIPADVGALLADPALALTY